MSKLKSSFAMAVGAAAIGTTVYFHQEKYSSESIWRRQKGGIEKVTLSNTEANKLRYEQLKKGLDDLKGAGTEEKCKFELKFAAMLEKRSDKAAEEYLNRKSYNPYLECQCFERIKETGSNWKGWIGIAGLAVFISGLVSFIESLRKRGY
ncbi:hypothetical protein JXA56_00360 [Candidatus Micrarchaeota archaeon]|nr:hypothetical protein [Candidatus Micrarchaeota archaeon]